jgi:hypothetical protein
MTLASVAESTMLLVDELGRQAPAGSDQLIGKDPDRGADSCDGFDGDAAVVRVKDLLDQGQAETVPGEGSGSLCTPEAVEDVSEGVGRHSGAFVGDFDPRWPRSRLPCSASSTP